TRPPQPLQPGSAATTAARAQRAGGPGATPAGAPVGPAGHEAYQAALEAAGHGRGSTRVSNPWSITVTDENPDLVWERNKHHYHYRWDYYRKIRAEFGDPDLEYGLEPSPEAYRAHELLGSADGVLEALGPHVTSLGLTDVVLFGPHPGIDLRTQGIETLQKFAEEVLPTLKTW